MRIEIHGSKIDVTSSLNIYVREKIGSLSKICSGLEKENEIIIFIEIARTTKHHKHGDVFYAEATIKLPGKTIRAENKNEDARMAIGAIKDILKIEIEKYKERKKGKRKNKYE